MRHRSTGCRICDRIFVFVDYGGVLHCRLGCLRCSAGRIDASAGILQSQRLIGACRPISWFLLSPPPHCLLFRTLFTRSLSLSLSFPHSQQAFTVPFALKFRHRLNRSEAFAIKRSVSAHKIMPSFSHFCSLTLWHFDFSRVAHLLGGSLG